MAPLDFLRLRDGRTVHRQNGGGEEGDGGEKGQADKEGEGAGEGTGVFDEVNVRALGERLGVWERAVRARPNGRR